MVSIPKPESAETSRALVVRFVRAPQRAMWPTLRAHVQPARCANRERAIRWVCRRGMPVLMLNALRTTLSFAAMAPRFAVPAFAHQTVRALRAQTPEMAAVGSARELARWASQAARATCSAPWMRCAYQTRTAQSRVGPAAVQLPISSPPFVAVQAPLAATNVPCARRSAVAAPVAPTRVAERAADPVEAASAAIPWANVWELRWGPRSKPRMATVGQSMLMTYRTSQPLRWGRSPASSVFRR